MIIVLEKIKFIEAVRSVARFTQHHITSLPVLSCILIVAGDDGVRFRATNLETGIDFKIDGICKATGVVAIPATILQQIAASLTNEGSLTIEQTGDTAIISFNNARSVIKTIAYEDFPIIPLPTTNKKNTINGAVFKSLIETVAVCASTSTVRPDLSSIAIFFEGGVLTFVATDSFRLAEKKKTLQTTLPNLNILIPAKNSTNIIQTIPDNDIIFMFDEHQVAFLWNESIVTTRLTNGTYPDYRQIIPKKTTTEATFLKKDFEAALRRTAIFSDTFQKLQLGFDPKKQHLTLTTHNQDTGSAKESITAKITGAAIEQSFNHHYLQTPLSLINTESITVSAGSVGQPLTIRGVGDNSFLYLVMPMNQ
ncbi:MAG: DNA polymerase III subunit beta [Parcubacteria group bacterium 21-54-25]|nr:MAG: DNA polymerase III subunit beta [Parcubacteria group bacterium 21-54-25]HQU07733.1 DNA polymerase III subunit beta [Candidatus Paceibacterota bacterium]